MPFSVQAIQTGQYTHWSYVHAYINSSVISPAAKTVANGIADEIFSTDADIKSDGTHQTATGGVSAGVLYNSMTVSRALTEGGAILHN